MKQNLFSHYCWGQCRVSILMASLCLVLQAHFQAARGHDAAIKCLVLLSDGKSLVGGPFTSFGGQPRTNLVRLNADGSVDESFILGTQPPSSVNVMVVQPDGKVVIAGDFTTLGGRACPGIGRLNADGTVDKSFAGPALGTPGSVACLAVQDDGKVLVGGYYIGLMRLNADGTLDRSFKLGADISIALAIQRDGKILVGRTYTINRLNADGTQDKSFAVKVGAPGTAFRCIPVCIAVQKDGRILVVGDFESPPGAGYRALARFTPDGTLEPDFKPALSGFVNSLALQTDGKVIAGGSFWRRPPDGMDNIERLNSDGTLDRKFVPIALQDVFAAAIRSDGTALLGGNLMFADGQNGPYVQHLGSPGASQTLFYDGASIIWQRNGPGPEIRSATFEVNTDSTNWVKLGDGAPAPGGWQLSGVSLSAGQLFRGRGCIVGSSSGWIITSQTVVPGPTIIVQPADRTNFNGTTAMFSVGVAAAAPCEYQWSKDGALLPGATERTLVIPNVQLADVGAYDVVARNVNGSQTSSIARLTVVPRPEIEIGDGTLGVAGDRMQFSITGLRGQAVVIESSTDLKSWSAIRTNVLGSLPFHFEEPMGMRRFYRLRMAQ